MNALFHHGPSPLWRLLIAVVCAFALMIADAQERHLGWLRATLTVAVYPLQWLAAQPSRLARDLDSQFATGADLRERNSLLESENLALRGQMQRFLALQAENSRLRDLLGSSFKVSDRVLVAELLQVELDPYRQQVLVDKGTVSGVYVGQPVLDANAVMGQVVVANPLTATVLLITDADHALPVQINRNGLRTIATGTGRVNQLRLHHLPKNADVRVGDLLVTSGMGGVFPPGYPVAQIVEVADDPNSPFATVQAVPTARLDRSHEVLLVWTLDSVAAPGEPVQGLGGSAQPADAADAADAATSADNRS
ncbi:rod shape-determining protein MreC [Lamprobacter modestohalophilus]|uniref:Cell shape-determining protein MreC n=1 Tax=Lamprobacter modestohalophilus TaxID=1064514 RepID=A0A9X1B2Q0_9GAMM|nr:rod shape-determining protein MreC [Lamprobacter modestohalophilus]MCF7979475.1 rod shape-determining protein MreC [Chromatiaceae bacterium]MCF7995098.1 rod shape-determining protein MreC [Chromatiaceae bacterium]MCF8004694.1 rod shape-determining protein MreC [Chromatiaceae bacterium]MCF8016654.1 rod shape-determining protein MreC [Chromatiaceae bacterium]